MKYLYLSLLLFACGCKPGNRISLPLGANASSTGSGFYKSAMPMQWKQRDSMAVQHILSGNIPSFLKKLVPVHVSVKDPANQRIINAVYYVTPDYLSIGTDGDWARIPLTPIAAQLLADSLDCFLPTRKMVDDIYTAAVVKLEPVPMYIFRDSTVTMWQHHLIIEGQRKQQKGLIAGIKKDVVISGKITRDTKPDRVAIYGWHKSDGKAIQPLYTGHVNWYVDYSHGIRLVYRKIKVDSKWMDYTAILKDPVLQKLICDEEFCDVFRY